MSDPILQAKTARETLARALGALQADPTVPPSLLLVAEPVAQAMSALHAIERSAGPAPELRSAFDAREHVRRALNLLQAQTVRHAAIDTATEAVAVALGIVFGLTRLAEAAAPAAAPAPAPAPPGSALDPVPPTAPMASIPAPVAPPPPMAPIPAPVAPTAPMSAVSAPVPPTAPMSAPAAPAPLPAAPPPAPVAAPAPLPASPAMAPLHAAPVLTAGAHAGPGAPPQQAPAHDVAFPPMMGVPSPLLAHQGGHQPAAPAPHYAAQQAAPAPPYAAQQAAPQPAAHQFAPQTPQPAAPQYAPQTPQPAAQPSAPHYAPQPSAPHYAPQPVLAALPTHAPAYSAPPNDPPAHAAPPAVAPPVASAPRGEPAAAPPGGALVQDPFAHQNPFVQGDPFAQRDPFAPNAPSAPNAPNAPASAARPAPPSRQGDEAIAFEAPLGTNSASNFFKGLSGNDVVEHGGIFVATYNKLPDVGAAVKLRVTMPGGYEFDTFGVVAWTREQRGTEVADAMPGFGVRFTQIAPEARQLVYRYVRNREPLFHDDA